MWKGTEYRINEFSDTIVLGPTVKVHGKTAAKVMKLSAAEFVDKLNEISLKEKEVSLRCSQVGTGRVPTLGVLYL